MPTYNFINKKSGETFSEFMSISEMEQKLKENEDLDVLCGAPLIGDPIRLGLQHVDERFRERLHEIKKAHKHSTMDIR